MDILFSSSCHKLFALSLQYLPHFHFRNTAGVSIPKNEVVLLLLLPFSFFFFLLNSAVWDNPGDAAI